jgi:hypothetical protein
VPEPFFNQIFGSNADFLIILEMARTDGRRYLSKETQDLYDDIKNFILYYEKHKAVEYDDPHLSLHIDLHINLIKELSKK